MKAKNLKGNPLSLAILVLTTAFTLVVHTEGFILDSSEVAISCQLDQNNCTPNGAVNCTCSYNGIVYSPVYDSETTARNHDALHILKYNL